MFKQHIHTVNFLFYFKDLLHRNSLKYMWGYKIVPITIPLLMYLYYNGFNANIRKVVTNRYFEIIQSALTCYTEEERIPHKRGPQLTKGTLGVC